MLATKQFGLLKSESFKHGYRKACLFLMQARSVSRGQRHPPSPRGVWFIHRGGWIAAVAWFFTIVITTIYIHFFLSFFALLLLLIKAVDFAFHVCIPLRLCLAVLLLFLHTYLSDIDYSSSNYTIVRAWPLIMSSTEQQAQAP